MQFLLIRSGYTAKKWIVQIYLWGVCVTGQFKVEVR